jgi:hypothetical protein
MATTLLGTFGDFGNLTAAVGALGTAASSLVDATKAFSGGVSNIGFSFIRDAVKPYQVALNSVNPEGGLETIRCNWLSGMAAADQLPAAKALIRLGATAANAAELALTMPNLDSAAFVTAITKSNAGQKLDPQDKAVLQVFDDSVGARLSAAIARADQKYKNSAKAIASAFAIALAIAGVSISKVGPVNPDDLLIALIVGVIATPVAPVAKDLFTALSTFATAIKGGAASQKA